MGDWGNTRGAHRARSILALVLVVLAAAATVAGGVALYMRQEVIATSAFADRAAEAVRQPGLQHVIAREIVVRVVEPSAPDVVAARPVVTTAVRLLVGSRQFTPAVRLAALHGHRLLFERNGGNAIFDLADAGTLVATALRTLAPKLARDIPARTDVILLTLRKRSFATETLRFAETVRIVGILLPLAAVVLYALAFLVVPTRRRTLTWCGVALGVAGIAFAIAFELVRRYVVSQLYGSAELNTTEVRGAARVLWDAYLGDLLDWALVGSAVAWLVAAVAAGLLAPYAPDAGLQRVRGLIRLPAAVRPRTVTTTLIVIAGVVTIVDPRFALTMVALAAGCVLIYFGFGELLMVTAPAERRAFRLRVRTPRRAVAFGALGATITAGIIVAFAFTGATRKVSASATPTCNGYTQLCDRRLDEVVFAGTHNSMSAADTPGWLIANQDRDLAKQLADGIRLFKISTHYAVKSPTGGIYTDIAAEGARLNRVAAKLPLVARETLQRLSRSLAHGAPGGKRDIWLCHTLCELGATRFVDFLTTIRRFLDANPDEVMVLFDEDYVTEADLQNAFQRARLLNRLATLKPGQPLPTLGDLIRAKRNIVVFAQKETSGKFPWNHFAFDWIQDTPLGAKKPAQFTCKLYRGQANDPLLMMNNWADIFPPRPTPNVSLVKSEFILNRARQCIAQRGRLPGLILTDYYNRGGVVKAVAELNGVANVKPVETAAVDPP